MASKLSAGIFGKSAEEEAAKIGRSARATAAANMMAKEKGSVASGLGELMPIIGAIGGGIVGGMAGDPVTGAKIGSGLGETIGGVMKGTGEERAQQAMEQVAAEEAMVEGMSPAQTKMANMAKADKKSAGSKMAGAGIDIMDLLSKNSDKLSIGGM